MKKIQILSFVLLMTGSTSLFAQIDNLCNMSAEWIRSGTRNAATDAADVVVYNPAGLTKMVDGFHINMSNQSLFRHPSHSYDLGMGQGVQKYEQGSSDPFLPNIYMAYKKNNWAMFTGIFNSGGGATMDYPHGSITTDLIGMGALGAAQGAYGSVKNPMMKASSMYLTSTLGGSYAINKGISVSMAMRYISAKNTAEAAMTLSDSPIDMADQTLHLNTEDHATGMGGVISMNMTSVDHLDLSIRYESQVAMNFKTKQNTDDFGLTTDGEMNHRDLPAVFAFGAAYEFSTKCKMYADMNYYFQENADWGKSSMLTNEVPLSELAGDVTTCAMSVQYMVDPKLMTSMGIGYTMMDFKDKAGYYTSMGTFEVMQSSNCNMNMGCSYKVSDKVSLNGGYMHIFYPTDQKVKALIAMPLDVDVTTNNSMDVVSVGVNLTF